METSQLKKQLINQIFEGIDPSSDAAKAGEKLMFFARILDVETRKLFKPSFQTKDDDDEEDDDGKSKGNKYKNRIICISRKFTIFYRSIYIW